jgi:hypothetical protein
MKVDVILSKRGDRYLAQISNFPEIRVKGASREAALSGIAQRLRDYLARVELVRLDLDESQADSLLLKQFGSFRDDPTFDGWLEEIAAYRQERNQPPD